MNTDEIVGALGLPAEPTLVEVITRVAEVQSKRLRFKRFRGRETSMATGFWLDTPDEGLILYRYIDPVWYQVHGVCHELGHILLSHSGCVFSSLERLGELPEIPGTARRVDLLESNPLEMAAEEIAYALGRKICKGPYPAHEPQTLFG